MRWIILIFIACLWGSTAHAQIVQFSGGLAPSINAWLALPVGGGGFVTGIQIYANGAQVAKTDTAAAFYRSSYASKWTQLVTQTSMPSGSNVEGTMYGACAIAAAPSNTNHLYLYYAPYQSPYNSGNIYESTNAGATWTETSFGPENCNANDSSSSPSWRLHNYALQVDPQNENVVYVGTPGSGVFYRTSSGGSWTQISTGTIPVGGGGGQGQGNLVYFDPSDATGNTIYISSYGNGIWKCTSASSSPSCTELNSSGMPTTFSNLIVDQDGTVWVVSNAGDSEGSLYRYLSGTWSTQVSPASGNYVASVAVNPSNASDVYALDYHGYINYSTNAQAATPTWSGYLTSISLASSLIPWIPWSGTAGLVFYSSGFDPSQTNVLYAGEGIGVMNTTPPTSGTPSVTWNANQTAGIENLVGETAMPLAAGGFVATAWDRPLWILNNSGNYPSQYYPAAAGVVRGYTGCVNGTVIGLLAGGGMNVSTNGGSTWSGATTNGDAVGGLCAVLTSTNWIWSGLNYSGSTTSGPYFSSNSGSSWSACTYSNSATSTGGGWGGNYGNDPIPQYLAFDPIGSITLQYNDGGGSNTAGLYELTSTSSCSFTYIGAAPSVGGSTKMLFNVPGQSGNFAMGGIAFAQGTIPDTSAKIYLTQNSGSTWTQVANVESSFAFGFGAAMPGSDGYPTLYCVCYVNNGSGYTYGIWRAKNVDSSPTWTSLGNGYPNNSIDLIVALTGDLKTAGVVYGVFGGGTSFFYGQFNYLLNRDLDPASNDNSPVGLNQVA